MSWREAMERATEILVACGMDWREAQDAAREILRLGEALSGRSWRQSEARRIYSSPRERGY